MRTVRDIQFAIRTLTRSPGFTTIVVLTLGLGIGASTAIFTLVNTVLLRPLEYPRPEQLVRITSALRGYGATDTGVANAELADYQARTDLFTGVAGILPISANVTSGNEPARVEMMLVSWNYFAVLGVSPEYGRVFEATDDVPNVANIAVVSNEFWRRSLNADPQAVGRSIEIDGDGVLVVGVMPASFRHPGRTLQNDVDVWSPSGFRGAASAPLTRARRRLDSCLARLQPGVTLEQAHGRLVEYGVDVSRQFPADYPPQSGWTPRVTALQESVVSGVSTPMLMLLGAVSLLLLIAFVNVAHLVLARAAGRRREMAIRQALGARAGQLTRQLVTESAVLALAGGALGLVIASWALGGLITLAPGRVPRIDTVTFDFTAVLVAIGIGCGATAVFGLVPSWQLARADAGVTAAGSPRTTDWRAGRARHLLVVAEVAMATILLIGAGLLVRSIIGLVNVPLGFDPDSLLTARISLPRPNDASRATYLDPARRVAFVRETLARVGALPGVERVAMATQIPMGGFNSPWIVEIEGETDGQRAQPVIHNFQISPSYFETMRIRIVRGRPFTDFDRAGSEPVAIVSEAAARAYWKGHDAIGTRLRLGPDLPWMTVIGIASDVLNRRLNEPPQPILYRSLEQSSDLTLALLIRMRTGTRDLAPRVAREVRAVDGDLPLYAVRMMPDVIGGALSQRQFLMRLLVAFGAIAAALALLGIYGVMAYSVSQRTREIGIRMAIGARQADMSRMIIGRGLLLTATGVIAGAAASLALSRFVQSQLFAVSSSDPLTIGTVAVLMTLVATLACYVPARRAASTDPVVALRCL